MLSLVSDTSGVIASVGFRNYKALRATSVTLGRFNLVIGPNGSGKTSLMEALSRLRDAVDNPSGNASVSRPPAAASGVVEEPGQLEYHFSPPHQDLVARLRCSDRAGGDVLTLDPPSAAAWPALRERWRGIRVHVLDHTAMAAPARAEREAELAYNGANLAAVLARIRREAPDTFSALTAEMLRITPEFHSLELDERADGSVELGLRLADNGLVTPSAMSQGMLYLLAMLALAFDPTPPEVLCLEDVDRGIHPRMLREVRDALYRLSYPGAYGMKRAATQVVVTTHSPYFIDLFREHPEEVIISQKHGRAARFERLSERPDLPELLQEGALGDMWFSGILGGVPDEP